MLSAAKMTDAMAACAWGARIVGSAIYLRIDSSERARRAYRRGVSGAELTADPNFEPR